MGTAAGHCTGHSTSVGGKLSAAVGASQQGHYDIGHYFIGHNYNSHNHIGHNYIGHDYMEHKYDGHDYISHSYFRAYLNGLEVSRPELYVPY